MLSVFPLHEAHSMEGIRYLSIDVFFSHQRSLNKRHDSVLENDSIKTDFATFVQTHLNSQHTRKGL